MAWLLIFVLLLTSVNLTSMTVLAYPDVNAAIQATERTPPYSGPGGYTGDAHYQKAWLIYIEKVENTCKGEEPVDAYGNPVTQCAMSAMDEMLYSYPKDYVNADTSLFPRKCFIVTEGVKWTGDSSAAVYIGNNTVTPECNMYNLKDYPWNNVKGEYNCVSDNILYNDDMINDFRDGKWGYEEYQWCLQNQAGTAGGAAWHVSEAAKRFLSDFNNIGELDGYINGNFASVEAAFPDKVDVVKNAKLLDIMAVISWLATDTSIYEEYITDFLKYQNRDESPCFYVPVIIAGITALNEGDSGIAFYSLPTWVNKAYGGSEGFDLWDTQDVDFGNFSENATEFENKVWEYLELGTKTPLSNRKFYHYRIGHFFKSHGGEYGGWRGHVYSCMPTNAMYECAGNLGYTYIARGGNGNVATTDIGTFRLTATSDQNTVEKAGTKVAATLHIDLKCSDADRQKYLDTFKAEKDKGHNTADLVIEYSLEKVKGDGSSTPLIDKKLGVGSVLGGTKLEWSNVTYDDLEPYLEGGKLIDVVDQNITINDTTTNRYEATVTLKFPGNELKLDAAGKEVVSDYVAADKVSWALGEDEPDKFHYYSAMGKPGIEDNYVEIKQGSPGSEGWEAMAGVPTTENLYVGFGATEFMMNFNGERKTQGGVVRKYNWTYTAPKCIEDDEPCVISKKEHTCPHTKTVPDGHGGTTEVDNTQTFQCGGTCSICGDNGGCPGDTHNCGHAVGDVGVGCQFDQKVNNKHPHPHTWTGTVEQGVSEFAYLDITDIDAWMLSQLKYRGNPALTNPSTADLDPNLGYAAFTSQGEFKHGNNSASGSDGNGRLVFFATGSDQGVNNENIYGNTDHVCGTNGDGITVNQGLVKREALAVEAWKAINDCVRQNSGIWCEVVSDYVAVQTSEGWQIPCSYTYPSDSVSIGSVAFAVSDTDAQTETASPITFSRMPRIQDMWQNNDTKNCAAHWAPQYFTRSGYNGHYSTPGSKWDNGTNVTVSDSYVNTHHGSGNGPQGENKVLPNGWNRLAQAVGYEKHPNSSYKVGSSSYATGFGNLRMTKTGLDINDVMSTQDRTWPQSSSEPRVTNGEQDTGHGYTKYRRILQQGSPGGVDYSAYESDQEVGYTNGKPKINNIVVHNPVSTQNAYIICNDDKYDLRSPASLADGGDPDSGRTGCPGDTGCQYQTLKCTTHSPAYHTAACYAEVNTMTEHIGGLNTHGYHMSECTHVHSMADGCYGECGSTSFREQERGHYVDCGVCGVDPCLNPVWVHEGNAYICNSCGREYNSRPARCTNTWLTCTKSTATGAYCTSKPNVHKDEVR